MSQSGSKEKANKRGKVAVWFNNIFRTRLEIDSDKILEQMTGSNDNQVRGDTTFYYSRGGLQEAVKAKLGGEPKFITLKDLSVTYWCDVPTKIWNEFQNDGASMTELYGKVNDLTDRLVGEWAKRQIVWERSAAEADGNGDKAGVDHAISEFAKDCVTLSKECEVVAVETIGVYFSDKVKTYGDYKRYKAKAGCKLAFTFVGLAISIAALSTAATPAAPATLVPAIIGIASAAMSIGKQIADLAANAEMIEAEVFVLLQGIEVNYKDKNGKPRKKTYKAREFATGFVSGMTGGFSDVFIPSIKALKDTTGLHKSKLDGLDVKLHEMGISVNAMVDGLEAVDKVIKDNLTALEEAAKKNPTKKETKAAQKALGEALKKFEDVNSNFLTLFEKVAAMMERIKTGRGSNEKFSESLDAIEKALGTKNFALVGNILATLTLSGIGFASGAPSTTIEQVMTYGGLAFTGLDQLREYGPDVMEAALS